MRIGRFTQVLAGLFVGIGIAFPVVAQKSSISADNSDAQTVLPHVGDRVVDYVDDARMVKLAGNVHPMARPDSDVGRTDSNKLLERVIMVLKRSPEQEAALAAFNERQYDPNSPDFHHWLTAEEFGRLYGPSDADIASVTNWLQNHGMQIDEVGKGRVYIQFTGAVGDVERAFRVEMHNYLVDGKMHLSNDRDPQIPAALSPVVTGLASLHDFFPTHYSHAGNYVKRDLKTGKYTVLPPDPSTDGTLQPGPLLGNSMPDPVFGSSVGGNAAGGAQPQLTYVDPSTGYTREELTPYDVATIYNILPLWNAATPINGTGVKVAIVGLSDVAAADINTYRSSFGLPATTLTTVHSGADPGLTASQGENTEDVEMVSATAPGAQIVLVSDVDTATTDGLITGILYIVNNAVAPILTMSYGECELKMGTAGNALYNQTFQQAATAGISAFVSAGDSGSAACTPQNGISPPYSDPFGLAVNGMASSPYVTAVGGTDLQWTFVQATNPISTYWNATNDVHGATAKGYMPEMPWNGTCTNPLLLNVYTGYTDNETLCNAANLALPGLVQMGSGGGGVSNCTVNNSTPTSTTWFPGSCSGGYAKPTWQTGVVGIPADGKRDLPDISLFGSYGFASSTGIPGSALLICQASGSPQNSCDYTHPGYIIYQENGGTSASSPMAAGVMALVLQKVGTNQGLANPMFYSLAAKEDYAACNSNTVAAGNACIFYDTTTGSNAMNCTKGDKDCVTSGASDVLGILSGNAANAGYDLATGLGSFNVTNLVNAWAAAVSTVPAAAPGFNLAGGTYHSPQSLTLTDATPGASIYYTYTANGTIPTTASTLYTAPITINATGTVEAIAVAPGYSQSRIGAKVYVYSQASPAAAPAFNLAGGTYHSPQTLVLTDTTPGATIYYTTNGASPTTSSTVYSGPIPIASTELIAAAAIAPGFTLSPTSSKSYTYVPYSTATAPVFSLPAGSYNTPQMLTLTDATPGAAIYYTINGTAPNASSTKYTAPVSIAATELVEAVAIATGYNPSPISSKAYTFSALPQAASPAFSLPGGHYTTPQMLTVTDATPGAAIYYTTNGTIPTTSSTLYVVPIAVSTSETIEAIAVASGYANSRISAKAYTIP